MNEPQPRPVWPSPPTPDTPPAHPYLSPPTTHAAEIPLAPNDDGTNGEGTTAAELADEHQPDEVAALFAAAMPPLPSEQQWKHLRDRIVAQLPLLPSTMHAGLSDHTAPSTPYASRLQRLRKRPAVAITAAVTIGVLGVAVLGAIAWRGSHPAATVLVTDTSIASGAASGSITVSQATTMRQPTSTAVSASPDGSDGIGTNDAPASGMIAWAKDSEVILECVPLSEDVWLPVGRSPLADPIVVARGGDLELLDVSTNKRLTADRWTIDEIVILIFEPQ